MSELAGIPFFAAMTEGTLNAISAQSFVQASSDRVVLMQKGAAQSFLFTVLEGEVEFIGEANGDRHTLQVAGAGTVFSLLAIIEENVALSTARTLGPARVMLTPAELVRSVIRQDPQVAFAALRTVSRFTQSLMRTIHGQRLRNASERLASWILHKAEPGRETQEVPITLSKQQIAALLGMSPESLARNQVDLGRIGVSIGKTSIRIESLSRLQSLTVRDPILDAVD